jgi:alkylation response protein AidB-like acyl-CoA dehydrogenase
VSLPIEADHVALSSVVRAFLVEKDATAVARAALDADEETMPPYWRDMAALGWMGLHLPEEYGGSGFGVLELAIVLEEMGRVVAGGPFLPTVLASAVLAATGSSAQCARWLRGLANGDSVGTVCFSENGLHWALIWPTCCSFPGVRTWWWSNGTPPGFRSSPARAWIVPVGWRGSRRPCLTS